MKTPKKINKKSDIEQTKQTKKTNSFFISFITSINKIYQLADNLSFIYSDAQAAMLELVDRLG